MALKILYVGVNRKGTPLPNIMFMVKYNHPEVIFEPYEKGKKGDVILGVDRPLAHIKDNIKKVVVIGGIGCISRYNHSEHKKRIVSGKKISDEKIIFMSDYCKNIFLSKINFSDYTTLLRFGPLPADNNKEPVKPGRKINGPIVFIAIAKWYKRPYKRLHQIIELYHNFLKKEYPGSLLRIFGTNGDSEEDGVFRYKKTFHDCCIVDVLKNSHIHIIPTPFDTAPKTISESLHYRVPFVCSNNCTGIEYINQVGKCGIEVQTDPFINNISKFKKHKPITNGSKYVKKSIPYRDYFNAIKEIIENFEEYTSWEWNKSFNYMSQSDNLYQILSS